MILYVIFTVTMVIVSFSKKKFVFPIALLLTIVYLGILKFIKFDGLAVLCGVPIIWLVALCIRECEDLLENCSKEAKAEIQVKEEINRVLYVKKRELAEAKAKVDKQSFTIGRIYEVIKAMSGMLNVDDMAQALSAFLRENFSFSYCYLAVFSSEDEDDKSAKKIYKMSRSDARGVEEFYSENTEEWLSGLVDLARSKSYNQTIRTGDPLYEEFSIDRQKKSIDMIPLVVENKIIAVLLCEDLNEDERDNFLILSSQLAMELKKANLYENVERLSIKDGLTDIYLRRYFMDRLIEEAKRAKRQNLTFAILMLDIDNFKHCNDTYGHMVGDVVLKEVAATIKENVREIDLAARYGGEEFVILLPDTNEVDAVGVAERIRRSIEGRKVVAYDETVRVKISIGITIYPVHSEGISDLINKADQALYFSKQKGRNLITVYNKKLNP